MSLFITTVIVFGFVIFIMAIGVMFGRNEIQGSCGGEEGCEMCFFKHGKTCEGKLSGEVGAVKSGDCDSSEAEPSCKVGERLGDVGK